MWLGDPKTSFAFGGIPPNQRSRALYPVQWKRCLFWFSNFFSGIYVSTIWEIFIENIFSDIFFEAFVSVLFQLTQTCSVRVVTTFPHFLPWLKFFFCEFILSGHCFWEIYFRVYSIFFVAQCLVYGFISSIWHVSTCQYRQY